MSFQGITSTSRVQLKNLFFVVEFYLIGKQTPLPIRLSHLNLPRQPTPPPLPMLTLLLQQNLGPLPRSHLPKLIPPRPKLVQPRRLLGRLTLRASFLFEDGDDACEGFVDFVEGTAHEEGVADEEIRG